MLTKRKTHRILLLVQYKSSVVTSILAIDLFLTLLHYIGNFKETIKGGSSCHGSLCIEKSEKPDSIYGKKVEIM
jgi:hypothetical protein